MSTALEIPDAEPVHRYLVRRTVEACYMAKEAAAAAAEGVATGSIALLNSVRRRERELDTLDIEIDTGVTSVITDVDPTEARELLACMIFMISGTNWRPFAQLRQPRSIRSWTPRSPRHP